MYNKLPLGKNLFQRPHHINDQLEYLEESCRPEETCCHSESSQRSPVKTGVKTRKTTTTTTKQQKKKTTTTTEWIFQATNKRNLPREDLETLTEKQNLFLEQ